MLCSAGLAFTLSACSGEDATSEETGSMGLSLELASGVVINEVDYLVSGNGITPIGGTVDTSAPGATASAEVYGLPPGQGYLVELSATAEDGVTICGGSAPFDVTVGVSTDVMVRLSCKRPPSLGGVRVNGKFNLCAELLQAVVSPLQTSVGNEIALSAIASDDEGDAIQYVWSGTGGSIADPSAVSTTYTCTEVGDHSITIAISDDDFEYCMDQWTVPVTCVEGEADLCEGVVCEDDGNECTVVACNPSNGACEVANVEDGTECEGGTCTAGECVESGPNTCAEITRVIISPLQTSVGNDISLSAVAIDDEGDAIQYLWSGTGGSIAEPDAASTTYSCGEVGEQSITIAVSDDDFVSCIDEVTVPVTCVEGPSGPTIDFDSLATGAVIDVRRASGAGVF